MKLAEWKYLRLPVSHCCDTPDCEVMSTVYDVSVVYRPRVICTVYEDDIISHILASMWSVIDTKMVRRILLEISKKNVVCVGEETEVNGEERRNGLGILGEFSLSA